MAPKWITFLATAIILISCQSSSTPDKNNAAVKPDEVVDKNLPAKQGIFSYTIGGKQVVAKNYVQHANLFINEVSNDAANGTVKIKVTCEAGSVFDFQVANSGNTTITNYNPSLGNFSDKKSKAASYMEGGSYKMYYGDSVTVAITSVDANRVSGTFSGTFKADADDGGATIKITDGSFNLPFEKN